MRSQEEVNNSEGSLGIVSTTMPQGLRGGFEELLAKHEKKIDLGTQYESISVLTAPSKKVDNSPSATNSSITAINTSVECDYEKNPTSLYKLLEKSEWKLCRIRARTFAEEVQTWVVRRDRTNKNIIKWRLLPLHASILFRAPFDVIEALILAYPEAVKLTDDRGMLPLHLALHQSEIDKEIVSILLRKYPAAINMKDNNGRVPIALAKNGRASLATPIDNQKTGETSTLMELYSEASIQALRKKNNEMTVVSEGIQEDREPSSSNIVQGTVVEPPTKFNDMMHLAELRTQAEAHERQMARLTEDNENNKRALLDDFEERTKNLEKVWKSKLSLLKDAHNVKIKTIKSEHKSTLQTMNNEHDLNMDDLRESLDKDIVETKELNSILKEEVADLKKKYEVTSGQSDMFKTLLEGMKMQRAQLSGDIQAMAQDQDDIIQVVLQQRQEIDTAYAVRDKIINSLLEQEDDDRLRQIEEGDNIMDLVETSRDRMETILKRFPIVSSNGSVTGGSFAGGSKTSKHVGSGSIAAMYGIGLTSIREDPRFAQEDDKEGSNVSDDVSALSEYSR